MTGGVRVAAVADGRGGTALPLLAGEGALAVRRTGTRAWTQQSPRPKGAAVTLVGAMSAPLGGDRMRVEIAVGADARLTVRSAAATVALPGRGGESAWYDVLLTVAGGAELLWLPEPLIAAAGSDLRMTTRVDLVRGARLVLREEAVLGRYGESPGRLASRLTVTVDGRPLLDQDFRVGPGSAPGWDGPAGLAGHRAFGQLLVAGSGTATLGPQLLTRASDVVQAVATPLAGGAATLVTALAPDARHLRPLLARTLEELLDGSATDIRPVPAAGPP
ncbi:urease accessory protein UreD [Streptomyces sp. PLK6-54]|uniref:Urease accessory protein UreD n=1 Tax=Actinacidiphila acidipaludis TaxID=2873382 RepID=A0ABS7QEW4_9ACTN|nr:urease accessory protein UreD [Streptomyces acidipaludis]MBY8881682.1 urease accessory protein UreD [Streptomyces acidipaludis]